MVGMEGNDLLADLDTFLAEHEAELIEFRRDVHTPVLLGVGLFLAEQATAGLLPGRVRLVFQPAEEAAGGALDVLAAGGIASVGRIFALHCDPRLDAGQLGVRSGAITAACDRIQVRVSGPGGHTAPPHPTAGLGYAPGQILTEV